MLAAQRAKDRGEDAKDRIQEISGLAQDALQANRTAQGTQNETIQGILRRM